MSDFVRLQSVEYMQDYVGGWKKGRQIFVRIDSILRIEAFKLITMVGEKKQRMIYAVYTSAIKGGGVDGIRTDIIIDEETYKKLEGLLDLKNAL